MVGYIILGGMVVACIIGIMYEYRKVNDWNKVETIIMITLVFISWVGCGFQLILWYKYPPTKY